jgi:molybdopterin/thiamine biosynthesis adenylyltransferase
MSNPTDLIEITDPQEDRFASLRLIKDWDQEKLLRSTVLVVGAGAIGNEVLKNLALVGIGTIFIIDLDRIEISNLSRSILYRAGDKNRWKAEIAAERVMEINDQIRAIPLVADVIHEVGTGLYRHMDVVIGCLDNREARMAVNRACWRANKPWVDGALNLLDGLVRVFIPPDGSCYECGMTDQDYQLIHINYSCKPGAAITGGRVPTTPTAASIIGGMQVQEAVKLLHNLPVKAGRVVYYSGESLSTLPMQTMIREDCPVHETFENIEVLSASVRDLTLEGFFKQAVLSSSDLLLLDDELVRDFYCPKCEREEKVFRPHRIVVPHQAACPACGTERIFDIITHLALTPDTAQLSFEQLMIQPFAILRIRTTKKVRYIELTGDWERIAANLKKHE